MTKFSRFGNKGTVRETEKAVLFKVVFEGNIERDVWFPKSQLSNKNLSSMFDKESGLMFTEASEWVLRQKEQEIGLLFKRK